MSHTEETMRVLREVMGEKMFGQDVEMSKFLSEKQKMIERSIHKISKDITEAVIIAGQKPIFGSHKVIIRDGENEWLRDTTLVAAKIRTVMDTDPEQFLCYAAYWLEEARKEAKICRDERTSSEQRLERFHEFLHKAEDLEMLRKMVSSEIIE